MLLAILTSPAHGESLGRQSGPQTGHPQTRPPAKNGGHVGLLHRVKDRFSSIISDGTYDLYLSGYARHGRSTYTPQRIQELNEAAWGGGVGKTLTNSRGNDESLYVLAFSDSHYEPEYHLGYAHRWMFLLSRSALRFGVGLTGFLVSRVDYFDGTPFPAILPVCSLATLAFSIAKPKASLASSAASTASLVRPDRSVPMISMVTVLLPREKSKPRSLRCFAAVNRNSSRCVPVNCTHSAAVGRGPP